MKKLIIVLSMLLILVGCSSSGSVKYKVGVIQLIQHDALDAATKGFVDTLKAEFGDEVYIDEQVASGDANVCLTSANNFVADEYDLIMANATAALQAAAHATDEIPVLGTSITEYGTALAIDNFDGVVGTNVSGTSDLAPLTDQAQIILDLFPEAKTVGIMYCSSEPNSLYQVKVVEEYLKGKGVAVERFSFAESNEIDAVAKAACDVVDVLYIPTDNSCASNGKVIANAANEKHIPIITGEKDTLIKCQGVATLSIDYYALGEVTGEMAIRILKGEEKVSEMAIEYDANPVKMYSPSKAKEFNLEIPSDYVAVEE